MLEGRDYLVDVHDVKIENASVSSKAELCKGDSFVDDDAASTTTSVAEFDESKTKARIDAMNKKVLPFQRFSKETFIPQMMKDSQMYMEEMVRLFKIFTQSHMRLTVQNFFDEISRKVGKEFWFYIEEDEVWKERKADLCSNQELIVANARLAVLTKQEIKVSEFEAAVNEVRFTM